MHCPNCQHTDSRVLESRSTENGQSVRRRRECLKCKHRFTTYERIEYVPIRVIKKDGSRESFDRSKILRGMVRACEKTKVSLERLSMIVDEIETQLQHRLIRDVSTQQIGELVLKSLRAENEVAYVRFASVYGNFQGIKDFISTLDHLQNSSEPSESNLNWSDRTTNQNTSSVLTPNNCT
ncbi:transcriptional regulator NrdR [Aphanothece hegewaldii CCALA 016]|uniref:Transcriptional repressor NrdR n=1 Tax=Aphanothece hegewaldii CCALA 016 TaxID=2107694 RepID=A0A2T1LWK1_9CHRO|nr:transcriptional regulator NrdR [Aphanothece hegewaldii]PSF36274.1 transcriptional regulator NrdR [Aphanothece hegewaldii CCALA 016]